MNACACSPNACLRISRRVGISAWSDMLLVCVARERQPSDAERDVVRAGETRARADEPIEWGFQSLNSSSSLSTETAAMTVTVPAFPPLLGYVPREYLAQGGQSIVYRALNHATNHLAALKVVPLDPAAASRPAQPGAAESAELSPAMQQKAKQLVREMRIHETLDHKNILRLFGGETRHACVVETEKGTTTAWPTGLYMVLDLGQSRPCGSPFPLPTYNSRILCYILSYRSCDIVGDSIVRYGVYS